MEVVCRVCNQQIPVIFYRSGMSSSITSLGELFPEETIIHQCRHCSHIQTKPMLNLKEYYDQSYKILANSEDEDQLYVDDSGHKELRAVHQAKVLMAKIDISRKMNVLDYGSGKAATLKKIYEIAPSISPHVFDVSSEYQTYWEKFISDSNCSVHVLNQEWRSQMDLVVSFFSLEHVEDLYQFLQNIHWALRDGGELYGVVPNMYENSGDFLVLDHINHFSEVSLRYLLQTANFENIEIDPISHYGSYVFHARKSHKTELHSSRPSLNVRDYFLEASCEIRIKWLNMLQSLQDYENQNSQVNSAIYGSGFYGSFIASGLKNIEKIDCFIDQNPYKQGKKLFGKPIIGLEAVPKNIRSIYVGLNPNNANNIMQNLKNQFHKKTTFFYLR